MRMARSATHACPSRLHVRTFHWTLPRDKHTQISEELREKELLIPVLQERIQQMMNMILKGKGTAGTQVCERGHGMGKEKRGGEGGGGREVSVFSCVPLCDTLGRACRHSGVCGDRGARGGGEGGT